MKDAKAAADKLARQIGKAGLQSLECVLEPPVSAPNLTIKWQGRRYLEITLFLCKQQEVRI